MRDESIVVAVRCKRLADNPALVAVGNPALVAVDNPALVAVGIARGL
jgi:hypothetical protein